MKLRRMLCLLCAALVLSWAAPACPETTAEGSSWDFDLAFRLNARSFPELLRTRAEGYASLVNRLGLRGTVSWSAATQSADLEAVLYFTDNPSLSYPFRLYGTQSRVFLTSPLINNEIILLNMTALMEFSMKARNTLGVPLSNAALLYPYATLSAFDGLIRAWQSEIGFFTESGEVTPERLRSLSDRWADELRENANLDWWINGVASGSDAPSAVEAVMNGLPYDLLNAAGDQPVAVSAGSGFQNWQNAAGDTLFACRESGKESSVILSLPAGEAGYVPAFSFTRRNGDGTWSFDAAASLRRDPSALPAGFGDEDGSGEEAYEDEYEDEYGDEDDYESSRDFPELLLDFRADGAGLPAALPADASFSVNMSLNGALYPDFALSLRGETKKDGAVTLSLNRLSAGTSSQAEIFSCSGTFLPAASPMAVPDYMKEDLENVFNVFSINEQKIPDFNRRVLSPLVRNILSFVAVAPTSACQSLLDDLTDIGLLDMLLD